MNSSATPELKLPYGPGFILVDSLDKVDPETMTVETTWKVPDYQVEFGLHLADHFPPPNKPLFPGVMQLQLLAESAGMQNFRVTHLEGVTFYGSCKPGEISVLPNVVRKDKEVEVDPITYRLSGSLVRHGEESDKTSLQIASMLVEELFEGCSSTFLINQLSRISDFRFSYTGTEVIIPQGAYLSNLILTEHMCQTCITINSFIPEYRENQFWLCGINEANFFSDAPWGATLKSKASVDINRETRRGISYVSTFLDDAPIAEMELTFAVVKSKKHS